MAELYSLRFVVPPRSMRRTVELAKPPVSGPDYAALTRRKLLNTVLAFATFAVVWLVVSPARAMAPICDPRGAVGFAPPPQMQDEERSLDIPADCVDVNPLETKNYMPGCPVQFDPLSSQEPVTPAAMTLPAVPFVERLTIRLTTEARPPPGVRGSVDRPPRV